VNGRGRDARVGGQRGLAEVQDVRVRFRGRSLAGARESRDAAGAAQAVEESGFAQARIRGRDGGATDPERDGELTFGGQPIAHGDSTVQNK
jgi:hypothetical protein